MTIWKVIRQNNFRKRFLKNYKEDKLSKQGLFIKMYNFKSS